jgi:AbiV family abortive infection protein
VVARSCTSGISGQRLPMPTEQSIRYPMNGASPRVDWPLSRATDDLKAGLHSDRLMKIESALAGASTPKNEVNTMSRRNYKNNLEFIEAGFTACWQNTQELVKGAKVLFDSSVYGLALSISVLALEELGKLFCLDGLLFASANDDKAALFAKSMKSHAVKLSALELVPMLLGHIASVDPRYGKEARFGQAIAFSVSDLKVRGNNVLSLLDSGSFHDLDKWKQSGFYSQPQGNSFVTPAEVVERSVAESVYMLAWRASSTLDFLLKHGNLERYIASARDLRSKLTEEDHQALEEIGRSMCESLFPEEPDNSGTAAH